MIEKKTEEGEGGGGQVGGKLDSVKAETKRVGW